MTSDDFSKEEINSRLKELDEDPEYEIEQKTKKGIIPDYSKIVNGKAKKSANNNKKSEEKDNEDVKNDYPIN